MLKRKYIFTGLQLFILSPIFPIILGLISSIISKNYTDFIILCDDQNLEELKTILESDMTNVNKAIEQYDNSINILGKLWNRPQLDYDVINCLHLKSKNNFNEVKILLIKLRGTEAMIKTIEPAFKSSLEKQWFECF